VIEQYRQSSQLITQRFKFISTSESLLITIVEAKFVQAINNLLSNALKFTTDNGMIEVSIAESGEKNILIKIQNNGIGIPIDMQPFLFDKFMKARRPGIHGEPCAGFRNVNY
jgi:two-component system, OmpR family, sensor histidine kinase VicK